MYIFNISCKYMEYEKGNDKWNLKVESTTKVDSSYIQSILDAGYYFTSMGGTQEIDMKYSRRFGMQVSKITCISSCGVVKKVLMFDYSSAKTYQ